MLLVTLVWSDLPVARSSARSRSSHALGHIFHVCRLSMVTRNNMTPFFAFSPAQPLRPLPDLIPLRIPVPIGDRNEIGMNSDAPFHSMTTDRAQPLSTALTTAILPIALLTAAMIGLGFLVTRVLPYVWPFTLEDEAVRALVATRTPTWDRASDIVSLLAYIPGLSVALVGAVALMRLAFHRWRESLFVPAAFLGQLVVFLLTSRIVARARPTIPQLDVFPPNQSFPSGHVSAAVAVYGGIAVVLAMHARRTGHAVAWWVVLLVIPVAVAISRVYRGMHYPSDVTASFIAGLGCLWILQRAMLRPAALETSHES